MSEMSLDLDAIEQRWAASAPGEWRLENSDGDLWWDGRDWIDPAEQERRGIKFVKRWRIKGPHVNIESSTNDAHFVPDLEFIARAHQDIPALIAEIRRLRSAPPP